VEQLIKGYIIGFIDAEASFSVSIKTQEDLAYGVRLDPVFSITQSDRKPLELIAETIGAGRIIRKPGQKHLYLLVIDNMDDLVGKLIPFLDKYEELLYVKRKQYSIFKDIVLSLHKGAHRKAPLLKMLVVKAYTLSKMSPKSHRKRSLEETLKIIDSSLARRRDLPGER
jgi:hypothetical protein